MVEGNERYPLKFLLPLENKKTEFVDLRDILGRLSFTEPSLKATNYVKLQD